MSQKNDVCDYKSQREEVKDSMNIIFSPIVKQRKKIVKKQSLIDRKLNVISKNIQNANEAINNPNEFYMNFFNNIIQKEDTKTRKSAKLLVGLSPDVKS